MVLYSFNISNVLVLIKMDFISNRIMCSLELHIIRNFFFIFQRTGRFLFKNPNTVFNLSRLHNCQNFANHHKLQSETNIFYAKIFTIKKTDYENVSLILAGTFAKHLKHERKPLIMLSSLPSKQLFWMIPMNNKDFVEICFVVLSLR